MGFLDILLGRTEPVQPDLDVLFAIPGAACTVQAALGMAPTGAGAVCFKAAEGADRAVNESLALLGLGDTLDVRLTHDEFGFTWITCRQSTVDLPVLLTALHAVNSTLADAGFGSSLLCTVVGFGDAGHRLGIVYLFKRGTVYPFAPTGDRHRDTALEMRARAELARDLPVEPDLERWFPIWDAPVL
ncbi:hypothetical protein [Lentzea sp. HUAS12]|uniref:PspA-associated protein PspAB n=1 Tax=Lentzea sp. HUAS12 TaxID=2951806 RepID=UPI00209CAC7E|nr:hypothetical protein [Lentzea sp. HUAS12]USX53962.1 hypothetical protein ND450_07630 [Lentzea sp. HUAS12]